MYGPIDRNPVAVEFAGTSMILKNATGSIVEEIEVGAFTVRLENEDRRDSYHILLDVDEDGHNDIIYTHSQAYELNIPDTIFSYSVANKEFLWKQEASLDFDFSHRTDIVSDSWTIRQIIALKSNSNKIFATSYQARQFFPAAINIHDLKTGKVIESYAHPGSIIEMVPQDLNGDKHDEIIFIAKNNYYWGAILGILNSDNIEGVAPSSKDYKPLNLTGNPEIGYVRIPQTILSKYGPVQKGTTPKTLYYRSENEVITSSFIDFFVDKDINSLENPFLVFSFDKHLGIQSIGSSDSWDILARKYYQEGKLSFEPGFEYLESFKDSLEWWDGEKFVNYPTLANPYPSE
jgi:hypothetical protein